jgi:phage tail sheath protein FI
MELHGVKTLESDNTTKQTTTVNMSVIGLVGTAPDARPGSFASLTTGSTLVNNCITFRATAVGADGNQLRVMAIAGERESHGLPDTVAIFKDGILTIVLSADDNGQVTARAKDVVGVVNALEDSDIRADLYSGTTGIGIVAPFGATALSGGENEPFPLYTPALISGSRSKAKQLGYRGTLYADMNDILNQTGALVVVVRVETHENDALQRAAIIQGIEALSLAQGTLNYQPRILVAPEWSTDDGVGKALESAASTLRAVTYLDSPSMATAQSVAIRGRQYGGRVEMLRPRIMVTSDITGLTRARPYSAAAAGHRARIDAEYGYWWSKSNKEVYGFSGLEQVDSFVIGDANCVANQLNQANVSTVVMLDAYRHWGNRLCSDDPQWGFESVRRTADALEDSIQVMVTKNYIDRPIDSAFATSLTGSVNSYLRSQTSQGAINGGRCWLDPDLNTAESLAAGQVYLNVAFGPKSPAQEIIITYSIDNTYTVQALGLSTSGTTA